jgi:hypothetical protein
MGGTLSSELIVGYMAAVLRKSRTVGEALHEQTWVSHIRGTLGWQGLTEYLKLWEELAGTWVNDTEDIHHWKFEA